MKDDTKMIHSGRDPIRSFGFVNPPVYHASTVLFSTVEEFNNRQKRKYDGVFYGAYGVPTTFALADAVAELEEAEGAVVTSSGLSAVTLAITAFVKQGDHILVADTVYGPTRRFCNNVLCRFGVEVTYYDPLIGGNISELIRSNTVLIYAESPGSLTFEIQDIPAIASVAHKHNVLLLMDNTWGTSLFFKPFNHGVDVSIQAGTKYIAGHSDLAIGIITTRTKDLFKKIKDVSMQFGDSPGSDDCYLTLRGLRSMGARLKCQQTAGLTVAQWLQKRPEVKKVLYPALPEDPGYALWKRDFSGASSLFGALLHTDSETAVSQMLDSYRFFKIGASWGGFESLVIPANSVAGIRTAKAWSDTGYLLRYHIGLEDCDDLIADLEEGFRQLKL